MGVSDRDYMYEPRGGTSKKPKQPAEQTSHQKTDPIKSRQDPGLPELVKFGWPLAFAVTLLLFLTSLAVQFGPKWTKAKSPPVQIQPVELPRAPAETSSEPVRYRQTKPDVIA